MDQCRDEATLGRTAVRLGDGYQEGQGTLAPSPDDHRVELCQEGEEGEPEVACVAESQGAPEWQRDHREPDVQGFGVHAAKTYGDILVEEKGYAKWVVTTAREDPHNCSPRLIRLAKWLHNMEQQNMNPRAQAVSYHQKESKEKIITMTETGMTSADTKQMPSSSNDAMIQMMQQLMTTVSQLGEEVQDLKAERPHKKEGKAVSEVTSGSFEMMQQ